MILLKATFTIDDAYRENLLSMLPRFVNASREDEGCLSFAVFESSTEPNHFILLEEWYDRASLDAHEETDHVKDFRTTLADIVTESEPTRIYTVDDITRL